MSFTTLSCLSKHTKVHAGETTCPVCGVEFATVITLHAHQQSCGHYSNDGQSSSTMEWKCDKCGVGFPSLQQLEDHTKLHNEEKTCPVCDIVLTKANSFRSHLKQHDPKDPRVVNALETLDSNKCETCGKSFGSSSDLVKHRQTHELNKCAVCGLESTSVRLFVRHLESHDPVDPRFKETLSALKWYRCYECGKIFNRRKNFDGHQKYHAGETTCDICGIKCSTIQNLNNHKKKIHPNGTKEVVTLGVSREHKCDKCEKSFPNRHLLVVHHKSHNKDMMLNNFDTDSIDSNLERQSGTHKNPVDPVSRHVLPNMLRCDLCTTKTASSKIYEHTMKCHKKLMNKKLKLESIEVTCSLCKAVVVAEEYAIHLQREVTKYVDLENEHANLEKTVKLLCKYCGCVLSNPGQLRLHQETHEIKNAVSEAKSTNILRKRGKSATQKRAVGVYPYEPDETSSPENEDDGTIVQPMKCEDCGQTFATLAFFEWHRSYCKEHYCRLCCSFQGNLGLHAASVHESRVVNDEGCMEIELDNHEDICSSTVQKERDDKVQLQGPIFPCSRCMHTTTCPSDMKEHLDNVHGIRNETRTALNGSINSPLPGDGRKYCCHVCCQFFYSRSLTKCHILKCEFAYGYGGRK